MCTYISYQIYTVSYNTHNYFEFTLIILQGHRVSTVVEVLCYKSEGHWFDPSVCQWIFH